MIVKSRRQLLSYLNPEQRLLILLSGYQNDETIALAKEWLVKPFNWTKLIALAERHRVTPLLYKNLKDFSHFVEIEIPSELKEKFFFQTEHVMRLATEGVRISEVLRQKGIETIFLKGPFLAQQIYGDIAIRPSRDIDILIRPSFIDETISILKGEGYNLIYPDFSLSNKQQRFYRKRKNQMALKNPITGVLVEVHWRLFSQNVLMPIPVEKVFADCREVTIAGKSVKVLSHQHNFEFLCVHGSIHQWFRLMWLRDIAQMLLDGTVSVNEVLDNAKGFGNIKPVLQAIHLVNYFFGTCYQFGPEELKLVKSIVIQAETAILSDEKITLTHRLSRLRVPIYKMKLKRGISYKLTCWSILQPNFNDWKMMKLPDSLFFLYFPLRPFIWFYSFYIKRVAGKKS